MLPLMSPTPPRRTFTRAFHRGQVQHGADQGLQLLLDPSLEVFIAAAHLQLGDAAEHHIERAGAGVGQGVNAAVDVAVLDQPCCEQGSAAFEVASTLGLAAVSEDRLRAAQRCRGVCLEQGAPKGGWATGALLSLGIAGFFPQAQRHRPLRQRSAPGLGRSSGAVCGSRTGPGCSGGETG